MLKKNKKILILLTIGIILIVSMFFVFSNKKEEYKELPKVKLKEQLINKQFALMLEQDNGEYKESEGELPTEGYVFNKEKSGCTDINGKIMNDVLDYDYENYIVLLDTSKTSYCYLYYDIEPNISYLRSKDTDNHLTTELTGGMYRYQGIYETADDGNVTNDVENYICLGENCTEDGEDLYRIIGINAQGELKVIKKNTLPNIYRWANKRDENIKWPDSELFHRLNDIEEGTYKDSSFYSTLNSNIKNLIVKRNWIYGETNIGHMSPDIYNGNNMYAIETGNKPTTRRIKNEDDNYFISESYTWDKEKDIINAYIGLQYIHDYLYAYPGGNPGNENVAKTSWIHFLNNDSSPANIHHEWTMTSNGYYQDGTYFARILWDNGYVGGGYTDVSESVRPVFYLSSEIELTGIGTLDSPFQIKNLQLNVG